jgi:hypothetical protein
MVETGKARGNGSKQGNCAKSEGGKIKVPLGIKVRGRNANFPHTAYMALEGPEPQRNNSGVFLE